MNTLYKNLESLSVLEQLGNKEYDFIYLDIPYNPSSEDFVSYELQVNHEMSIRHYIAKNEGIRIGEVTREEVNEEHDKWEKLGSQKYSSYVSRVIINTQRLLKDDGVLALLAPPQEHSIINYKLVLDQIFPSVSHVTIHNTPALNGNKLLDSEYLLYFCSKKSEFSFPVLMNLTPTDENFVPVPTTWEYKEHTRLSSSFIDSQSMDRMFSMFVDPNSCILCPYDRNGKFAWLADKYGAEWTSIWPSDFANEKELFCDIPEDHYIIVTELSEHCDRTYQDKIVTTVYDIEDLKELGAQIKEIQTLIGVSSAEDAIEQIHELIVKSAHQEGSRQSIEACLPEAKEWVSPYWEKMESNSQFFLPTGIMLYNQLVDQPGVDMAAAMIEYCKSLEMELYNKIFCAYIQELMDRDIVIREEFPGALRNDKTRIFANTLRKCLEDYRDQPEEWRFEFGKMAYALMNALSPEEDFKIFDDFRSFLESIFEEDFFEANFDSSLDQINDLRNDCAHPSLINNNNIEEAKNIIREKLLRILENYKDK